jgi:hypothetical protein
MSESLAKIGSYGSQPPQMLTDAQNAIQGLTNTQGYQSGMNPNDWAKAYENRAWSQYNQNVAPQISNQYLGSSFWNSRRNTDLNQAAQSTGQDIALQAQNVLMNRDDAARAAFENAQRMRLGAAGMAPQMSMAPQQLAIGAGQQQMGLDQAALTAVYNEFIRTLPERNSLVTGTLGMAQQPTMNTIASQGGGYNIGQGAMGGMMGGIGAALIPALANPAGIAALVAMGLLGGVNNA